MPTPLTLTAPAEIWLQVSTDPQDTGLHFATVDPQSIPRASAPGGGSTVAYRRADLARCPGKCKAAASTLAELRADARRLDWLADPANPIGQVLLPEACVTNNLANMRGAIDEAMRLDPEVWREVIAGTTATEAQP